MVWRKISSQGSKAHGVPFVKTLSRLEIPRTQTLQPPGPSETSQRRDPFTKTVPYLSFKTTVSKNSRFEDLTEEQREELGGIELRALDLLAIAVPAYWFGIQLLGFVILAPYMSRAQFRGALTTEDGQAGPVNSTWYFLFAHFA